MPSARRGKSSRWVRPCVYLGCCLFAFATHRLILEWISANLGHWITVLATVLMVLAIAAGSVWAQASEANPIFDRGK